MVKSKYKPFHAFAKRVIAEGDQVVDRICGDSRRLQSVDRYEGLRVRLQTLLQSKYYNVKVHLYGSRILGLATNESDLDIFVEIGNF